MWWCQKSPYATKPVTMPDRVSSVVCGRLFDTYKLNQRVHCQTYPSCGSRTFVARLYCRCVHC